MLNRLLISTKQLVLLLLLSLESQRFVVLGEEVGVLLVGRLLEHGLLPQVGSEERVGLADGSIGSLGEVSKGSSGATSRGVAILNTSHHQQLLGDGGRNDASTTGGRDQSHPDGSALSGHLRGNGVGFTDLVTPESSPDGNDGELGEGDGTTDGSGHLLAALNAKTNVSVVVTNSDESLESGSLTGSGLLLNRHDLQNLILEGGTKEVIDDLELFDGQREEVDLLKRLDLSVLDQTAELGDGHPLLIFLATATSTSASTATTATTSTVSTASSSSKTTSETTTIGWSSVRHSDLFNL